MCKALSAWGICTRSEDAGSFYCVLLLLIIIIINIIILKGRTIIFKDKI